jgi:hypothetical protein
MNERNFFAELKRRNVYKSRRCLFGGELVANPDSHTGISFFPGIQLGESAGSVDSYSGFSSSPYLFMGFRDHPTCVRQHANRDTERKLVGVAVIPAEDGSSQLRRRKFGADGFNDPRWDAFLRTIGLTDDQLK